MHTTTSDEGARLSEPAVSTARLLAATIGIVTEFEPIESEPVLQQVIREASRALDGMVGAREPEAMVEALDALDALLATVAAASAGPAGDAPGGPG